MDEFHQHNIEQTKPDTKMCTQYNFKYSWPLNNAEVRDANPQAVKNLCTAVSALKTKELIKDSLKGRKLKEFR